METLGRFLKGSKEHSFLLRRQEVPTLLGSCSGAQMKVVMTWVYSK